LVSATFALSTAVLFLQLLFLQVLYISCFYDCFTTIVDVSTDVFPNSGYFSKNFPYSCCFYGYFSTAVVSTTAFPADIVVCEAVSLQLLFLQLL
jgi:hypothetical protein